MMPNIFMSTVDDGSMKAPDLDYASVLPARHKFLSAHSIDSNDTTLVQVTYGGNDFCRYVTLEPRDKGDGLTRPAGIEADALVVTEPGHALFLPLADCVGAVIYDPTKGLLMLSHLGRHNLEQQGGTKCIEYVIQTHGCDPSNLTVWLSPAAGRLHYPLYTFDNRSLLDVATEQLQQAGITVANTTVSPIDSAEDDTYFSHSRFLAGERETDGRHAVVAVIPR